MGKNVLLEEYKNRVHYLMEYTNAGGAFGMNEDGEEDPNAMGGDPMAQGGDPSMMSGADPNMGGGDPGMDMGGDPSMGGGDPGMMGGDPSMMGGADPNMGGGDPMAQGGTNGVEGFNPQGADPGMQDPNAMGGEDEEVIDVDELVDSQEETSDKIDKLASSFEKLIDKVNSFQDLVNSSNERIDSLKAEIEKRNPTPVEKLSLRSKNGYPFAESPDEYWQTKEATSNYSTEDDNNGADDPVYQITKDEIDNFNDYASVAKSLDDDYGLRDMFGY